MSFKEVRDNWAIICAFLVGAATWGATSISLSYAKDEITANKTEIAQVKSEITTIRIEATRVATAAEEQRRSTERQIDQLIAVVEAIRAQR